MATGVDPSEAGIAASKRELDVVMFGGPADWSGIWYSRHHLSAGLAQQHRVVLVDEPPEWRDQLSRLRSLVRPSHLERESIGTFRYMHPGWLPRVYRSSSLRTALDRLRARALCDRLGNGSGGSRIAYVWHPDQVETVEALPDWPLVYHAYDRYEHYTLASDHQGPAPERRLTERASLCIGASLKLVEHLQQLGARNVRLLRHGVDPVFFKPPGGALPRPLEQIPTPRLGLVASLSDAVDYRALLRVADARRDWSLVMIGNQAFTSDEKRRDFEELERLPNVHWLGFRPRQEIPAWIAGFDVALTCYDLDTWAPFNQPLKLYEYLSCGAPVVSSDIMAARELGDLVLRVESPEGWTEAIATALASDDEQARERRRAFGRQNSWQQRVEELERLLIDLIA